MCLCTGTSGPDGFIRTEKEAGGKRPDMAVFLILLTALAVNLMASIACLGS
jgi:hypothetical protein